MATDGNRLDSPGHEVIDAPATRQRSQPCRLGAGADRFDCATTDAASRGASHASVPGMEFSRELRSDVLAGDITLSVRLWKRPRVKQGGR
jgi:hypothetical protein